ncbi:MAG TPA: exodeoxyribonuclease V subunit gamma [Kineosporiaceae bacterium]|nr:exodeoxyribonuclease V subunit gamma [Kineosporiaceae bacterium]
MLHLHRAERSDRLVEALGEVLAVPLADPFTAEVIAVPAKGVERWLSQQLSSVLGTGPAGAEGVSANLAFPSPDRLVAQAIQAVAGRNPDDDPWAAARVLWTTLAVVDDCVQEPWCGVLAAHLGTGHDDHRRGRRWATAAMLANRFTAYGAERPQMLLDWAHQRDTDGTGTALPDHLRWQAELWRRLRARIGTESAAERLAAVCAALRAEPDRSDLPPRISIFGPTRLSTEQLTVIDALAAGRDVHLWLPHPSPRMWDWLRAAAPALRRKDDITGLSVTNPLLASLARDTRELQQRLLPLAANGTDTHHPVGPAHPAGPTASGPAAPGPAAPGPAAPSSAAAGSLLAQLQDAVRDDRSPTRTASADATVQVHACHGPARQVEVLREALLHAFADDPTLEPRDVLVMCPDVETYAPLIRASFGQGAAAGVSGHPGHQLRVRLADRSLAQTNPLLDSITTMLGLAGDRVTASQVLDLAATAPVRHRFEFDDDDLEQLRTWAAQSGVRWGISAQQRRAYGLEQIQQNTWLTGLDRLLLGVAADETELNWLGRALPLDDVDSTDVHLAGRLSELIDRLWSVLASLQGPHPAAEWALRLNRGLELLTDVRERDAWQLSQAQRELSEAVEHAGSAPLQLADVRAMLTDRLAGRPTRANFRTGELTVATLVPMRSVPHRVVALLGLDDDVFPRAAGVDGDDILAVDPCIGERDRRSEDRQLLLDAVMSASERLIVLYTGADPVTGTTRPPAVPLGELLDVITVLSAADIVKRHPLQPFAPRNVDAVEPFSFDLAALRGARAAVGQQHADPPLLAVPLPPVDLAGVDLADLIAFVQHPVQGFLRQRLLVRIPSAQTELRDRLDPELDGLATWDIGERLLTARLRGVNAGAFRDAELRRGTLPPLRLGQRVLDDLELNIDALVQACLPVHAGPVSTVDVDLDLGNGRRLSGTVTGVHSGVLASSSYSSLAGKHRIAAWVRLLAIAASHPERSWQALTTGRGAFGRTRRSTLDSPTDPLAVLKELVALRDQGLCEPLPLIAGASTAYAERRSSGSTIEEASAAAAKAWNDRFGDNTDRHLIYVYGQTPRFEPLLAARPTSSEAGWYDEPSRFGVLARRLWTPLLAHEQVGQP